MPLAAGAKLGPYEILAPIGAGGMGEVYRAHDTKLKHDVAANRAAQFVDISVKFDTFPPIVISSLWSPGPTRGILTLAW
jgi:serine/threonine protein kinase